MPNAIESLSHALTSIPAEISGATGTPCVSETRPETRLKTLDADTLAAALQNARTGFPVRCHDLALPVLERARIRRDAGQIGLATHILAGACLMMGHFEMGIAYAREAREVFRLTGDGKRAARAGANLAWLLASIGEQEAINEALAALDLAEHSGDATETIWALDTNAIVLWLLHQHDKALPFAERAVELSRLHKPRLQRPLINLAGLRVEVALAARLPRADTWRVISDAITLTDEALQFARAEGDGWLQRLALCNIAEYNIHLGKAAEADEALSQVPLAPGEMSDKCNYQYLHILGRVRAVQGATAEAAEILNNCLALASGSEALETAGPCHKDLSDLYAGLGDDNRALQHYRHFHELYVRQASHAVQRRARLSTLEWEADRLRASVKSALKEAADLSETNKVLATETERLLRTSMEDPLTGLQNRRKLELTFFEIRAGGENYALAMIDIDNFKTVNDRFTHPIGDGVLRQVAEMLRRNARVDDVTVRFGGDEFAMLFRGADLAVAVAVCERLREGVQTHDWAALHPGLSVTLSIGVAASGDGDTHDDILSAADRRLYLAKEHGRNRVEVG